MTQLPMGRLVYTPVVDDREKFLAEVRSLGDAASKAIATGDKSGFRLELEKTAKAAAETTKALSPLIKASEAFERVWQGVNRAVETGALSKGSAVKQLRWRHLHFLLR